MRGYKLPTQRKDSEYGHSDPDILICLRTHFSGGITDVLVVCVSAIDLISNPHIACC